MTSIEKRTSLFQKDEQEFLCASYVNVTETKCIHIPRKGL